MQKCTCYKLLLAKHNKFRRSGPTKHFLFSIILPLRNCFHQTCRQLAFSIEISHSYLSALQNLLPSSLILKHFGQARKENNFVCFEYVCFTNNNKHPLIQITLSCLFDHFVTRFKRQVFYFIPFSLSKIHFTKERGDANQTVSLISSCSLAKVRGC